LPQIVALLEEFPARGNPNKQMAWLSTYIAAAYPSARDYLSHRQGMSDESLSKLCVTQTVLLGFRRCYEELWDEKFKQILLPMHQTKLAPNENQLGVEYGLVAASANFVLPATPTIRHSQARQRQMIDPR
jgi:hypothetical protein